MRGAAGERGRRRLISVLIADDQGMVRSGLRSLLERDPGIRVVGEPPTGRRRSRRSAAGAPTSCSSTSGTRPPEDLVAAVHRLARGDAMPDAAVTRRVIDAFAARPARPDASSAVAELSPRELQARGCSNAELAEHLVVSEATAKTHVSNILTKLRLRDRIQAVIFAYESGLVEPGSA